MLRRRAIYRHFAAVYDRMGADHHSVLMVAYTLRLMRRHRIRAESVLDLCCGTGTALKLFHREGMRIAGLDGSREMLREARRKLRGTGVTLYHQQLPHFSIVEQRGGRRRRRRFDLVTSYYDSLNYLTDVRSLGAAFRHVGRHLRPGGWFIFDMNTPEALKTIWGGYIWGGVRDDFAWIWRNEFEPRRCLGICRSTFFVRQGRTWRRFDEMHVERGYDNAVITDRLRRAGFIVRGLYRCFGYQPPSRRTTRICVAAQYRG